LNTKQTDISKLRENYTLASLNESDLLPNPIDFFNKWLQEAIASKLPEPNAMTLSTVNENGRPAGRILLLKEVTKAGFIFYTNYESRKAQEIKSHNQVAITFLWKELQRQVRIEGKISKISRAKSEAYFITRPIKSQMGAWASAQSKTIKSRAILEQKMEELKERFKDTNPLPIPENWGGYEVIPDYIEFWQGRRSRLHDRLIYELSGNKWSTSRLSP